MCKFFRQQILNYIIQNKPHFPMLIIIHFKVWISRQTAYNKMWWASLLSCFSFVFQYFLSSFLPDLFCLQLALKKKKNIPIKDY